MKPRVIGLFSRPWPEGLEVSRPPAHHPVRMYRWAVWYKANPRDEDYMRGLFHERFPEGRFINIDRDRQWRAAAARAEKVVLLYPDATGLGFARLEREVKRLLPPWGTLSVLNGRRREFRLTPPTLLALKTRRLLERSLVAELAATFLFLAAGPILALKDWGSGRT